MASNWTCRACLRSITCSSRTYILRHTQASRPQWSSSRHLSTTSPRLYAAPNLQADLSLRATTQSGSTGNPYHKRDTSPTVRLAQELRKRAPGTVETYSAYSACELLFHECSRHADYDIPQASQKDAEVPKTDAGEDLGVGKGGWWFDELNLPPIFSTWSQVTFLHMYILVLRFRTFSAENAHTWHQHLLDHFFYAAEHRMATLHNMQSSGIRQRYLKNLYEQWRGVLTAYDEGLVRGDAVLAGAVWRNVFKGNEEVVAEQMDKVAKVVGYMRREAERVGTTQELEFGSGQWQFEGEKSVEDVKRVLGDDSVMLGERFVEEGKPEIGAEKR